MRFSKAELEAMAREPAARAPKADGSPAEIASAQHAAAASDMREFAKAHRAGMLDKVTRDRALNEKAARALAGDAAVDRAKSYGQF